MKNIRASMHNKSFLQFPDRQKHFILPALVGLGISSVHFLITTWVVDSTNFGLLKVIMLAPYIPLQVVIGDRLLSNQDIIFSSLFYGVMAGLLASRKKGLIAIVIILMSMLTLCVFLMMIMMYDG